MISSAEVRHVMRYVNALDWLCPGLVLDAACGNGYGSKILAKYYEVIGTDISKNLINEARNEPVKGCRFIDSDLRTARFGAVDNIVSIETIEHFTQPDALIVLDNFYNWLNEDGVLVLSTPFCAETGPSTYNKEHLCEYSLTDIERLLTVAGFNVHTINTERHVGSNGRLGYCMVRATK